MSGPRSVVLGRATEDLALAAELAEALSGHGVQAWPAGPEIAADYASGELVRRLLAADALVAITTPALLDSPFALREARLSRALGRPVIAAVLPFESEALSGWLLHAEPAVTLACADPADAAEQVAGWAVPTEEPGEVVTFSAALIGVGTHGGTVGEAARLLGVGPQRLQTVALHLRAIGVVDWSPPLDEATTLIVIS